MLKNLCFQNSNMVNIYLSIISVHQFFFNSSFFNKLSQKHCWYFPFPRGQKPPCRSWMTAGFWGDSFVFSFAVITGKAKTQELKSAQCILTCGIEFPADLISDVFGEKMTSSCCSLPASCSLVWSSLFHWMEPLGGEGEIFRAWSNSAIRTQFEMAADRD